MTRPSPFHASLTVGEQVSGLTKKLFNLLMRCHDPQARGQVRVVVLVVVQARELLKILILMNQAS